MTRQNLSTGSSANDGTGEALRSAGTKINANLVELWLMLGGDSDNLSTGITFDSDGIKYTNGSFTIDMQFNTPTANRQILVPDSDGTVVLTTALQTLTRKTLNLPMIHDSDGNEIITTSGVASAVNELTVTNAAATNAPSISATGGDTNIGIALTAKGSGSIAISKLAHVPVEMTANGAASTGASYIICNKGTALAVSLADGTTLGESKIFTNKGAGVATVTPTNFAQGTTFALPQYTGAQVIWDSDNWYIMGAGLDSDITVS